MRSSRERPRIAFATLLALIVLVVGAGFAGSRLGGDDDSATQKRVTGSAQAQSSRLETARRYLGAAQKTAAIQLAAQPRSNRKLRRAPRRSARDARKISRLTRQLRRAGRAIR